MKIPNYFFSPVNGCASSLTSLKFCSVTVKQDKMVKCKLVNLENLEIIDCRGGNTFFSSVVNQSSNSLKKLFVKCQKYGDKEALIFLYMVDTEMKCLKDLDVFQGGSQFLGLDNILSRSPLLQKLKLTSPYDHKVSDHSIPIDQSITGINVSGCELRCITKLVLSSVILEGCTLKNLLSNVPSLKELELNACIVKGNESITCVVTNLLRLQLNSRKEGEPVIIIAPDLQVNFCI